MDPLSHGPRIDFWLRPITEDHSVFASNVSISAAPLTDYLLISLILTPTTKRLYWKDYWKFIVVK